METVLLDTGVASFLHPKKCKTPEREFYSPFITGNTLALSFQTVAELWKWAETNGWGEKNRESLDDLVRRFVVIPYDYRLAKAWAAVSTICDSQGRRLEAGDCWIAATAVAHNLTLLSHDKDIANVSVPGLTVISYFSQSAVSA